MQYMSRHMSDYGNENLIVKYLLEGLLHQDAKERFTAEQALEAINAKKAGNWAPPESYIELPQSAVVLSPNRASGSPGIRLNASMAENLSTSSTANEETVEERNATGLAHDIEAEECNFAAAKVAIKTVISAIESEGERGADVAAASSEKEPATMLERLTTPFKTFGRRFSSSHTPTVHTNNKRTQTPSSPPSVPDLR